MAKLNWTPRQKDGFVRENERLIHSVVHKYASMPYEYQDLYQMACVGLTKALNSYDDTRKTKITTYAVTCMEKEILYLTRKDKAKCRSGSVVVSYDGINADKDGDSMSGYDNMDLTNIDGLHAESVPMEEALERKELHATVMKFCNQLLTSQEKAAIPMTAEGRTQSEIGEKLGLPQAKVSRITRGARCKIMLYCKRNNIEYA